MAEISSKTLNRIKKSKLNTQVALATSIVMGVLSFVERSVFNHFFIEEYLGLYSFYQNVINILCTVELGLPIAISYALYAPLEYHDEDQILAIMRFFRNMYRLIGTLVGLGGLCLLPFLDRLVQTSIPMPQVKLYFVVFLSANTINFFLNYRMVLLSANQEQYKISLITNLSWAGLYVAQILISWRIRNFFWYAISIPTAFIIRDTFLRIMAKKTFPFLSSKKKVSLNAEAKNKIKKNAKGLIASKISMSIVSTTDTLLISAMIGTALLGKYSNYQMIIYGLGGVIAILPTSVTASIGNAGVTETKKSLARSFETLNLSSFLLYSVSTVVLINIINPIIEVFFGNRVLPFSSVCIIVALFYIKCMRYLITAYKNSLGLYWEDRKRPVIEALTNLITSIILGHYMGFNGILLGTICSHVFVNIMIEPRIIYHYGLGRSAFWYYTTMILRALLTVLMSVVTLSVNSLIPLHGLSGLIVRFLTSAAIVLTAYWFCFRKNDLMEDILNTLKIAFSGKLDKLKHKKKNA